MHWQGKRQTRREKNRQRPLGMTACFHHHLSCNSGALGADAAPDTQSPVDQRHASRQKMPQLRFG
jgi:hypothetical protein